MSDRSTRRSALTKLAALFAPSPVLCAQDAPELIGEPAGRITPLDEFGNVPEFEPMAERRLDAATFASIAEGDRRALDRITFRPRMMVNTKEMDLTLELFGQSMLTPIMVGPASGQKRFHPEGEAATARGATEGMAVIVTAEHSGTPIEESQEAAPGAWRQIYPDSDISVIEGRARQAAAAGCAALCLSLGNTRHGSAANRALGGSDSTTAHLGWDEIESLQNSAGIPVVLKGVMRPADARIAADRGISGIMVSNHGSRTSAGELESISALEEVVQAVEGRIPVLVDGGIRYGGDVIKALALGATAVMICRPVLWGLASYGSAGVQRVVEMLQTEFAKDMAQVGAPNLASIRRDHIRVHTR